MKKTQYGISSGIRHVLIKCLLMTKMVILLIFAFSTQGFANTYGQGISLKLERVQLKKALKSIEKQGDFRFVYKDNLLKNNQLVSINVNNVSLADVLDKVFRHTNLTYQKLNDRLIVIVENDSPALQTSGMAINISGRISNEAGDALSGVSVIEKGTNNGTVTTASGQFNLTVASPDAVLVISYIGHKTQEIPVGQNTVFEIVLQADVGSLSDIVVVGYGTQKKSEISGSVVSLTTKDFNRGVSVNATDLIQGKVSGMYIVKSGGDVTSGSTMRIRGINSLSGGNSPLVVIDGIPGGNLNSVAPQDIESISVLKDASASAIYGSRSGAGVVIITTKKGSASRTQVDYEAYAGVDVLANKPELVNAAEWRKYVQEKGIDPAPYDKGANTDWFEEITRRAFTQSHALSLSGGGNSHNYRASLNYLNRQGVVRDNSLERWNGRILFEQRALNDRLKLTFVGSGSNWDENMTEYYNFVLAYNMLPVSPVFNSDGTYFNPQGYDMGNPRQNQDLNTRLNQNVLYNGNIKAELDLGKGFSLGANAFKQRRQKIWGLYYNSITERGRNDQGYAQRDAEQWNQSLFEGMLNYKGTFGDYHNLTGIIGYSWEEGTYERFSVANRQFVTNLLSYNDLQSGENLRSSDISSGKNMYRLISFYGRLNYNFNERYLLSVSLRNDGSSKFGKDNKWAVFPAVSLAWNISEENFMSNADWINDLKLRAGYGITGNQDGIGPYNSLQLYSRSGLYYSDGSWFSAYSLSQNANPNLKWETTKTLNVGVDFSLFQNRLSGSVEVYDKLTDNLLYTYDVPVPPFLFNKYLANVGAITNKGVDLNLSADAIRKKDFNWNIALNFSHYKNRVTRLESGDFVTGGRILLGGAWVRGGSDMTTHIIEVGKSVGTFYGYEAHGLTPDGKYNYVDQDKDGSISQDKDRTYIGDANPDFIYGIQNTFTYKNWNLSFLFRGTYGNDVLNMGRLTYGSSSWLPGQNVLRSALDNNLSEIPSYSSYYIEDGSFMRLEFLNIGYNVPLKNATWLKSLRFFATGQNMFLITKYSGRDPEVDNNADNGASAGVEGRDYYPKTRTFTLGLNVSF